MKTTDEMWMCNACRQVYPSEAEAAGCLCPMHTHARSRILLVGRKCYATLQEAEKDCGPCPQPITEDGSHWWYNDWSAIERRTHRRGALLDRWPCACKTCGLRVETSVNAPDHPSV